MLRKRLAASVAVAPLLFLAHAAWADTSISTATTAPVSTSASGNVTVTSSGSVKPTTPGVIITIDSNNTVINQGTVGNTGVNGTTAIQANAGVTSSITNSSAITVDEDYTPTDTNNDGNLDGVLAQGSNRFGIVALGAFTGPISNASTGSITIEGNNSGGIIVAGPLTGNFDNSGTVSLVGTGGYGIHLGQVNGNVRVQGTVSVIGAGSTGVAIDGDVSGTLVFQGSVTTTGYRRTTRPSLKSDRDALGADDGVDHPTGNNPYDASLFSGSAVRVTGNAAHGILFDVPPTVSSSTTGDNDGDGILDVNDTDQDNDGVADASETSASIVSIGGAPAVLVGSDGQPVTLGAVGTGIYNYGFVNRGAIGAAGLYDGVNSVGIQFGGNTGQTTIATNGMYLGGSMTVSAFEANATAVHLTNGAQANTIVFAGSFGVTGISDGNVAANRGADGNTDATLLKLDAGSTVNTVSISGSVVMGGQGEAVNTVVLRDLSGKVSLFENTGHITQTITATDDANDTSDSDTDPSNEVVNGKTILVDAQVAVGNVVVRQAAPASHISSDTTDANNNGVYDADEPSMNGNILLGAHDDRVEILSGTYVGDMSFGAGADTLQISGAAKVGGAISDSDGALAIQVQNGALTLTNTNTINATSVTTAATNTSTHVSSALTFTADPGANHVTRLDVATADIGAGTKIGLRFTSLLTADTRFTVIHAGTLTAGALDQSLLGNSPYLYVTTAGATPGAGGEVFVDVTRRTAAQIGLNKEGTAAYNAIYGALFNDTSIRDAFLAQTTRTGFTGVFDQMLPSQGAGIFSSLMLAGQSATDGIAGRPDPHQRYGPDSFWIQEINTRIQRDTADSEGSDTKAFGFVSGYESMGDGGALGLTMAYVSAEERGASAQVGEQQSASLFEGGAYWRGYSGNLSYAIRGGVGFVRLNSDRKFIYVTDTNNDGVADTTAINKTASARWNGYTVSAGADVAYEARMGRFYARPSAGIDYLFFSEGAHNEAGGGAGFDLSYASRSSSRLDAEVMLALGAEFGRDSWWRPEVRVGYRQRLAGTLGDTVARFSGGSPFTTASSNDRAGALVFGFSLKAGTPMSYLALEGDSELSSEEMKYLIRLVGRVMF